MATHVTEMGVGIQDRPANIWAGVQAFEQQIAPSGRSVDVVRRYRNWSDPLFDDAGTQAIAAGKKCLFVPHAFEADGTSIPWADIAKRRYDDRIRAWAQELKDAGYPASYVVFHHEPEDDTTDMAPAGQGRCGTTWDFVGAFTRFYRVMRKFGVPRSIPIGVCLMGSTFRRGHPAAWIPTTMSCDFIASDGYSRDESSGQKPKSFNDVFGAAAAFAVARNKPFAIEECGVAEITTDGNFKANWYLDAIPYLQAWKMMFFEYSNVAATNFGGQDYRIDTTPQSLDAFLQLATALPWGVDPLQV
jgi:hypothetical protein